MTPRHRHGAFALVTILACGSEGPGETPLGPAPADELVFEVDWKPDTVQVLAGSLALAEPSYTDTSLRFGAPPAELQGVAAGELLLLEGVGLYKVLAVAVDDQGLVLDVEHGSLLEAAERGEIRWQYTPSEVLIPYVNPQADPGWVIEASPDSNEKQAAKTALKYTATFGAITTKFSASFEGDEISLETRAGTATVGGGSFDSGIKAKLRRLNSSGNFRFEDGELLEAEQGFEDFVLEGDLEMRGGGAAYDVKLRFPVSAATQIAYTPVPLFFKIGTAIDVQTNFGGADAARASGHFKFTGGFKVDMTSAIPTVRGNFNAVLTPKPDAHTTILGAGLGVLFEMPRVDFGIGVVGLQEQASAGVFVKSKIELVHNSLVQQNLIDLSDRQTCQTLNHNMGIYAGGALALLNLAFEQEHQLWGKKGESKAGPNCEVFE